MIASPRPGGNTATAVRDLLAGICSAEPSAESNEVHLPGDTIAPIGDCRVCVTAGRCDRVDDFQAVMNAVYRADLLVLGTPLYWYGPSGQLKVFLDRWSCLLDLEEERFRARMRGKRVVLVVAQGERGFYEAAPCLQLLEWSVRYLDMALVGRIVIVGHSRLDYEADEAQRARVSAIGASLAAAQDNDVMPPWFHLTYRPGDDLGGVFQPEQSEARI